MFFQKFKNEDKNKEAFKPDIIRENNVACNNGVVSLFGDKEDTLHDTTVHCSGNKGCGHNK